MSQITQFISNSGPGGFVQTLTGNSGGAVPPAAGNINVLGSGSITVTGNPGTSTLTISDTGGGIPWTVITAAAAGMAVNNGYIANNAGTCTLTLPAVSAVGSIIRVTGINNNSGWQIAQNAGNQIFFGSSSTTAGATGYLQCTNTYDSVELVCVTPNANWVVLSSVGNITVN